jgi:hypothetical protein
LRGVELARKNFGENARFRTVIDGWTDGCMMLKGRQVSKAEKNRIPSGNDGMEMWTWATDRRSRAEAAEWTSQRDERGDSE